MLRIIITFFCRQVPSIGVGVGVRVTVNFGAKSFAFERMNKPLTTTSSAAGDADALAADASSQADKEAAEKAAKEAAERTAALEAERAAEEARRYASLFVFELKIVCG